MSFQPIARIYKGNSFRSGIEMRWAIFFDAMGEPYEYEPEGFSMAEDSYLPDFYLPNMDLWVEVKHLEWPKQYSFRDLPNEQKKKILAFRDKKKIFVVLGRPWYSPKTGYEYRIEDPKIWSLYWAVFAICKCGKLAIGFEGYETLGVLGCCGDTGAMAADHPNLLRAYREASKNLDILGE